jgi:hypothetical protein
VARLLALRLIKQPEWPRWRAFGVVLYLQQRPDRAATGALLRYAIETGDDGLRAAALDAVRATPDPARAAKLAYEVARARRLDRAVPASVAAVR